MSQNHVNGMLGQGFIGLIGFRMLLLRRFYVNNGDSVSRVLSVGSIRLSARSPRGTHLLVVLGGGDLTVPIACWEQLPNRRCSRLDPCLIVPVRL